MAKAYRHPYNRKLQTSVIERPPMPDWLRGNVQAHKRKGASVHSYFYWKRMYFATPPWLTDEDILEMALLYLDAGENEEVDHIIPLNHRYVCGLNVPWNLRRITRKENKLKSNHCLHYAENVEQLQLL